MFESILGTFLHLWLMMYNMNINEKSKNDRFDIQNEDQAAEGGEKRNCLIYSIANV